MPKSRYDLTCTVDAYRDGWTLLDFLAHRFRYYARAVWEERLAAGTVSVEGKLAAGDRPVRRGQRVHYVLWHEEPDVDFAHDVIHEDDHVLAVSKSGNLPVHAGGRYIRHTLIAKLRETRGDELRLAHRLDRETSGVVLLAKHRDAARALEREFHAGRVRKAYVALVRGAFPERLDVDAPIAREDPAGGSSRRRVDPSGKPSRTEFRRVAVREGGRCTVVLALPRSGRTNQIRVHASHAGFPILGDKIYGVEGSTKLARHLLHCLSLEVRHPATGAALRLHAPLPPDFERAWGGSLPAFGVSLPGIDGIPTGPFPGFPPEGRAP